jgi:archaellum component FlaF (FlaF/FlaG flagellin family)
MKKPRNMKAGAFAVAILFLAMTAAATVNATLQGRVMPVPQGEFETIQQQAGGQSAQQSTGDPPYTPPTTVTIDCGSITIDTGYDPDICTVTPRDNHLIDVGTQGAMVTVEVDYSIQCPSWDDHGFVDIIFDGTTISDSADSGETLSGVLRIEKFFNPSESFTVTLHAKIDYTYSPDIEASGVSHCDTAPAGPDPHPVLQLTPTDETFGVVDIGENSPEHPFTLKNIGTGTARGSVYIEGNDASNFIITRTSTGSTTFALDRDASMIIYVEFVPQQPEGAKSATLTADGSNCDDVASSLTGIANEY